MRLLPLTLVATVLVGPGTAGAASVGVQPVPDGEAVVYLAAPGERNDVRVERVGYLTVRFVDQGAAVTPGDGCRPDEDRPGAVTCFVHDLQRWEVIAHLGDGDDAFTARAARKTSVFAGSGDDVVSGEPAPLTSARQGEVGREDDSYGEENFLDGGPGDDVLVAGAGMDGLVGGIGHDRLYGGPGPDGLCGDDGFRHCEGTVAGNDLLDGGSWHDTLTGGGGGDVLIGGSGHDVLDGRSGDDWLDAATGEQRLPEAAGDMRTEAVYTGPGNDVVLSRDGVFDRVVCPGEGRDPGADENKGLDSDAGDTVLCANGGSPPAPPTTPTAAPDRPPIWLPSTATLREGVIRAVVRCPAAMTDGCAGTLDVRRTGRRPAAARRLGRARYELDAGQRRTVQVRLAVRARRSVARRTPGRVVLEAAPPRGAQASPVTRRVKLGAGR